ncbi:MAG: AtpZ/AtpI family protein [Rhodospirillaceae bacterium]
MVEDERRNDPNLADIDARLKALRPAVDADEGQDGGRSGRMQGLGLAFRITIELVSTVLVGVGIGWALDTWLGTMPVFMVVFLFFGGAAGVVNVYRVVRGLDDSVGLGLAVERKKRAEAAGEDAGDDDGAGGPRGR